MFLFFLHSCCYDTNPSCRGIKCCNIRLDSIILIESFLKMINDSLIWKQLQEHAKLIKSTTHLRDLLKDENRAKAFRTEHGSIVLDYARQNATMETVELLFALANEAKLREKIVRNANIQTHRSSCFIVDSYHFRCARKRDRRSCGVAHGFAVSC